MQVRSSLSIAAGFLATALSIPFISKNLTRADDPKPDMVPPAKNSILIEKDFDYIQNLRKKAPQNNLYQQEKLWTETVYPTIREDLMALYKAEEEDIKTGTTQKDRKVKLCLTDFLEAGEEGDDMDTSLSNRYVLHVVKYYDLPKIGKRIYVNERWPVDPDNGAVFFPDIIRIRDQAFKGSLDEKGAHKLFVTGLIQIVWTTNSDNSRGNPYPLLGAQPFYLETTKNEKSNKINDTELFISNPTSCISCHVISGRNLKQISASNPSGKINFGAVTQDHRFDVSITKQKGYEKYVSFFEKKVNKGEIKKEEFARVKKDLADPRSYRNPYMVESLKEYKTIPWLESDTKVEGRYDPAREGFTYTWDKNEWEKAIFAYYRNRGDLVGIGEWWSQKDMIAINGAR
ncbi:MAG: hypothetical protein HY094_00355 [Candidatus Melainabacteria bacterium]|nr:hypothetical protein [Candidatus Melainabacteria bacterium]